MTTAEATTKTFAVNYGTAGDGQAAIASKFDGFDAAMSVARGLSFTAPWASVTTYEEDDYWAPKAVAHVALAAGAVVHSSTFPGRFQQAA